MIWRIVAAILSVVVFSATALLVLLRLPAVLGLLWIVLLGIGYLGWQFRRDSGWRRRRVAIRLRPVRAPFSPPVVCCLSTIALMLGIAGFIELFAPAFGAEDLGGWAGVIEYESTLPGRLAVVALTVLLIPIVEEFAFRGRIQTLLGRRFSPVRTISVTALLFMAMHVGVPHWSILSISLTLGLANGAAVYLFGSIWPAVIVHGIWNGSMIGLRYLHSSPTQTFGGMDARVLFPLAVLLAGAGLAGWLWTVRTAPVKAATATPSRKALQAM